MSSVLFDITSFMHCSFPESKLSNLDFSQVKIKDCNFTNAILKNCVFQQQKTGSKNEKKKFDLSHTSFEHADVSRTLFYLCELTKANFQNANLEDAVFDKCDLKGANLSGANITGANFATAKIEKTILDVEGFITFGISKGFVLEQLPQHETHQVN
jgi:serine/threonine-protein kinase